MRRQIAVARVEIAEAHRKQHEMSGLLGGDPDPIVEKFAWQAQPCKTRDDVPGEVDRVELDMGERMQQRCPSGLRAEIAPLRHVARRAQLRPVRPCRAQRRRRITDRHFPFGPSRRQGPAHRNLGRRVRCGEDRDRAGGQGPSRQSACDAFSTSATCPGTRTLRQTPRTVPEPSIKKVLRSMPMYLRPYMLFSIQAPYFSQTSPSVSEARMNGRLCFFLNLSCEATESFEMPMTTAPVPP